MKQERDKTLRVMMAVGAVLAAVNIILAVYLIVRHFSNKKEFVQASEISEIVTSSEIPVEVTTAVMSLQDKIDDMMLIAEKMTLHEKVCQLFIVTPEALTDGNDITEATEYTKEALERYHVGGLIYFEKNLESQTQARELISNTKKYAKELDCIPLFYGIDEEGGDVARCSDAVGTTAFDPMYYYHILGRQTSYANARTIAGDLMSLGFNLDFAPVADTWSNIYNTVIGTRAYSDNFIETADLVSYAVKGFRDGGVLCTLKHFPGHGDTAEDSHNGTAVAYRSADELRSNEYLAFAEGIKSGADMIMTGHITIPAIDELPASLSQKIIKNELRDYLGYDGVIITDSLEMGAITNTYTSAQAAVMAINAGNDILLTPQNFHEAVEGVEEAVKNGIISEERITESVARILEVKNRKMDINQAGTE